MTAKVDRDYDDLLLVRGRLPHFTTQVAAGSVPQVRFWSICQNGASSTRVHGCLADHSIEPDAAGFYNVVISSDVARPASLPSAYGWLNFGPEKTGVTIIRELLAHPDFNESTERASKAKAATERGDFMPTVTYCAQADFNAAIAAGQSPGDTFATCSAPAAPLLPTLLPLAGTRR